MERDWGEGCWSWQNCLRWNEISSPYDISSLGGRTTFTLGWLLNTVLVPLEKFPTHVHTTKEDLQAGRVVFMPPTEAWTFTSLSRSKDLISPSLSPYSGISYDKKGVLHDWKPLLKWMVPSSRRELHVDLRL